MNSQSRLAAFLFPTSMGFKIEEEMTERTLQQQQQQQQQQNKPETGMTPLQMKRNNPLVLTCNDTGGA